MRGTATLPAACQGQCCTQSLLCSCSLPLLVNPAVLTTSCNHQLSLVLVAIPSYLTHACAMQVKNKMTCEGFLKNNRGINDGADLPADFMRALYDRIVTNGEQHTALI